MDFIIRLAEEFFKKHKRLARYRRIFAFLAAVVVFATTYELILPAITMDRQRAVQSPGVEVGVAKDQRKGIDFMEDDSLAVDTAGEDSFDAGFPEDGGYYEDNADSAGDGYVEDYSSEETGSADDWIQPEDPATGDTWNNASEIVPGVENTGDDYSGPDGSGTWTDENEIGTDAADNTGASGDEIADGSSSEAGEGVTGTDTSGTENGEADPEVPDAADGTGLDGTGFDGTGLEEGEDGENGLEDSGSAPDADGQDPETVDGEGLEGTPDASVDSTDSTEKNSGDALGNNTQNASAGISASGDKSGKGSTASAGTAENSGEAVIEGSTAETAVEFAAGGAAVGATDLTALGATGDQAAAAVTYPATIIYEGKDYTITATFDEKAKLPAEVTLSAVEILPNKVYKDENGNPLYADYEEYYEKTLEALEKESRLENDQAVKSARFFDITFLDKDGNTVEPAASVSIAVKYKDALSAADTADTMAVHFEDTVKADNTEKAEKKDNDPVEIAIPEIAVPEILDTKTEVKKKAIQEISFEAENFSVYGVIGTEVIEKTVLASDGHNYKITVTYGPEADIPQGAELEVKEISGESEEFKKYVTGTEEVLAEDEKVSFARFFDISIVSGGDRIQPKEPVNVRIELADELTKDVKAVHFEHQKDAGNETENTGKAVFLDSKLVAAEELKNAVSFDADGFSVYGVVETITTSLLTADGKTLKVTVNYDESAQIPKGATLEVKEIQEGDEDWFERSVRLADVLSKNYGNVTLSDARFLNISILVEGKEFEPKAPVQVRIEYVEPLCTEDTVDYGYHAITGEKVVPKEKENRFVAIHYTDDGADLIDSENTSGKEGFTETIYDVDGFSEYDLVYMYDYDSYEAGEKNYNPSAGIHTAADIVNATKAVRAKTGGGVLRNAGDIPAHSKSLIDNKDGTYTIGLNVTGDADTENNVASNANVIIIYDTSTSMEAPGLTPYGTWDDQRNNYVPMQYGGRGIDSSGSNATSYSDGVYFQLYRSNGTNSYTALTDDTYTGTVYRRTGNSPRYTYTKYTDQRYSYSIDRADASEKVVYDFTNALFSYQNPENPDTPEKESENIQAAFITFDTSANNGNNNPPLGRWTSNKNDILNRVDSSGTSHKLNYHNYTNWTSALDAAEDLVDSADDDPTYVVFITDGRPQTQNESAARPNYNTSKVIAQRIQNKCHEKGGALYGVFAFANDDDWLSALMYYAYNSLDPANAGTSFETEGYYKASDTTALTQAINEIFQKIVNTLGVTAVSISDGTTSAVQTTSGDVANLLVVEDSYQYWLTLPVTAGTGNTYSFIMPDKISGENVTYTAAESDGTVTITWPGGSASYPGKVEAGNKLTLEWTSATDFYRFAPPPATHNTTTSTIDGQEVTSSAVDWDLNSLGTLLDGVTYTVTFDCYPSQFTLDTIADLKNAEDPDAAYNALDENIRKYLIKDENEANEYILSTNTEASLTYTDTRTGNDSQTKPYDNPDPVKTSAVEEMAIAKEWENQLDDRSREPIELEVTRDAENHYEIELNDGNEWNNKAFISIGIMTTHNDIVSIKAPGHDFSFAEPTDLAYYWELDVPTVHPMKIDGVDTMLVEVTGEAIPDAMKSLDSPAKYISGDETYYKMNYLGTDKYYKVDDALASLTATNERRSSLNVTKAVEGNNTPEDALFDFTIKVDDKNDEDVWFSILDESGNYVINTDDLQYIRGTNVLPEIKNDQPTGFYYAPNKTTIFFKLKKSWNLRFMNLPKGTSYEVEESSTMPEECFSFVNVSGEREYYEYKAVEEGGEQGEEGSDAGEQGTVITHTEDTGTVDGRKISGTIAETNSVYTMTYTNRYDAVNVSVTKNVSGYDDGSTFEILAAVTKNGTAVAKLPSQSDPHILAVDGHPDQLKISLKKDETASIRLPAGVTLSIDETVNNNYTVTYSYKLTTSGEVQTGNTISSVSDGNAMTVTNTRKAADINLKKVAKGGTEPLTGAIFKLYRKNSEGVYASDEQIDATKEEATLTLTDGTLKIEGLPSGDYKLTEIKPPNGYIIQTRDIYFTVNADGTGDVITTTTGQTAFDSDTIGARTEGTNKDTLVIPNTPGETLPYTGGSGTFIYTLSGITLLMAAALMYIFRMRRRERRVR
ncbi:LPXTG-motif cell wall anchor domain-containing protein [Sarcina sp. DSM 11001]|uniref:SpaA isopeptide-forming pilin-related protein n=1 Tax=Sarcina sp. DSM 11001 TaxID=1798184 RepID=UPI000886DA64|nr:SpaA isopeptide-forming pilin-related protein [Sarcina sp. DSM 11001]SDL80382.1 LPXTG-motif cell wall anchor domain-containing protein [Sarcina sp. DSM 11001]